MAKGLHVINGRVLQQLTNQSSMWGGAFNLYKEKTLEWLMRQWHHNHNLNPKEFAIMFYTCKCVQDSCKYVQRWPSFDFLEFLLNIHKAYSTSNNISCTLGLKIIKSPPQNCIHWELSNNTNSGSKFLTFLFLFFDFLESSMTKLFNIQ
jgi:hypothetical protein